MIITDSSINLASQHLAISHYQKKESLKMWNGAQRPDFEGTGRIAKPPVDTVSLSGQQPVSSLKESDKADQAKPKDELDSKLLLLQSLLETLTGKKVSIAELRKIVTGNTDGNAQATPESQVPEQAVAQSTQPAQATAQNQPPARAGFGIEYDATETRYESEQTSFSAGGVIKTADGKEINFNLDLTMSREYLSQTSTSFRAGDAVTKDPLVINFAGTAAELSDTRFTFDIDADGNSESIASLGPGSGYLTLDRNQDGKINNGTELFGARTGNGFSELAAYDQNRDGWIDEQDAVFGQLQIWQGGSSGLSLLKDAGVGAINLASQQTPFALKDSNNQLLGEVKATGVYVKENGSVGTVQQLDLAV